MRPALSIDELTSFDWKVLGGANDEAPGAPRQTPQGSGGRRCKRAA